MLQFRCYRCWEPVEFRARPHTRHISCPNCGTKLYVGLEPSERLAEIHENPELHRSLQHRLLRDLGARQDLILGVREIIAGPESRHRPDAIFYHKSDADEESPFIFEVETCESIDSSHTISQCRLFSEAATKTHGRFYLVVPELCDEEMEEVAGEDVARQMLNRNKIDCDRVWSY